MNGTYEKPDDENDENVDEPHRPLLLARDGRVRLGITGEANHTCAVRVRCVERWCAPRVMRGHDESGENSCCSRETRCSCGMCASSERRVDVERPRRGCARQDAARAMIHGGYAPTGRREPSQPQNAIVALYKTAPNRILTLTILNPPYQLSERVRVHECCSRE